jgi:hypothetical protein
MQHGSGDYAASAPAGGHYYPHQYAPPGPNPYPVTDAGAGGYSAPPYSAGGYAEQPPSAPASYSQPPSVPTSYSQPASAPAYPQPASAPSSYSQPPSAPTSYSQPPPQYGEAYPPYNNSAPAPYLPEPYYPYPPPTQPAAPPAPELNPPSLPYDAPYYGGGYQPPAVVGYGKPPAAGYDDSDYLNEGVYAYNAGDGAEPYGARGTAPARSGSALFDDYGRSISLPSGGEQQQSIGSGGGGSGSFGKIVRAVPRAETREDDGGGAQKFRVKLLPEGAGTPTDVLCQVSY